MNTITRSENNFTPYEIDNATFETLTLEIIKEGLKDYASFSRKDWNEQCTFLAERYPNANPNALLRDVLNRVKQKFVTSRDEEIINLLRRSVNNFNTFSAEKADLITIHYDGNTAPRFLIPDIHLTFDIQDTNVIVTTILSINRNSKDTSLILDGVEHDVLEVLINDKKLENDSYKTTPNELIVLNIPDCDDFIITVKSIIDPFKNATHEGLYACGNLLVTQCEPKGAHRIFFTINRPDVFSCITTSIIADKKKYPWCLSNGNLFEEKIHEDGRNIITWNDPIPKPSYLYAAVLGDLNKLTDVYTTISGKQVSLEIYVGKGHENRASYALEILKKAMEFDEKFFDREYDLNCLKIVGVTSSNINAMKSRGLFIFNNINFLVDKDSGTDENFRTVASTIAHAYFHNWLGNHVTVKNWFEIALKEGPTGDKTMLFEEWLFGEEFVRPDAVSCLRRTQFPEDILFSAHPVIVNSYAEATALYDNTMYVKGREIFRMLRTYINTFIKDGYREALNTYFKRHDGKAVTFNELLEAGNTVLNRVGKNLDLFKQWFYQTGTPTIGVDLNYNSESHTATLQITQFCLHPKSLNMQGPLIIPFSYELIDKNGSRLHPVTKIILEQEIQTIEIKDIHDNPTPIFMHGYSAPVELMYEYSTDDLINIIKFTDDAFSHWDACQRLGLRAFKIAMDRSNSWPKIFSNALEGPHAFTDLQAIYGEILAMDNISLLKKVHLLDFPSVAILSRKLNCYDFKKLHHIRSVFMQKLVMVNKPIFEDLLKKYPLPTHYEPISEQMQTRALYNTCLALLASIDDSYLEIAYQQYKNTNNFNDRYAAFNIIINSKSPKRLEVMKDLYDCSKNNEVLFNSWLISMANSNETTVENIKEIASSEGYDTKNPNHIHYLINTFILNLVQYHDAEGKGYEYAVDKILEIGAFNPQVAENHIVKDAFQEFTSVEKPQQELMAKAMKRLLEGSATAQTINIVKEILGTIEEYTPFSESTDVQEECSSE